MIKILTFYVEHYDRTFPTTFRFCNKEEYVGCDLTKLPSMRDKNKLYISMMIYKK